MFLGVTTSVANWDADGTKCSLILEDNPLVDFVELPETCQGLYYCNVLCGVICGVLEMETGEHKQVLNGLATQKNIPPPTYHFTMEGEAHCLTFTSIVEINGAFYTGAPGKNKKEAAGNAAYEAIRSMHTQDSKSEKENAEHMSGRSKMLKRKNKRTNKN